MEQQERALWAQAVAASLRAERGVAGLSQAEVERLTGIARTSYRMHELGTRQPDVVQLAQIAEALRIPLSRLFAEIERRADEITAAVKKATESVTSRQSAMSSAASDCRAKA